MASPLDFFPAEDAADWRFVEKNSGQEPVFAYRSIPDSNGATGVRRITLDAPGHRFNAFFDRMAVSADGLELRRLHFANQAVPIPPWRLTLTPDPDRVDNVLSSEFDGRFGLIHGPFTGVTTNKIVTGCWTVDLEIVGNGGVVLKGTLRFGRGVGLCSYTGQAYGSTFLYDRVDEPGCAPCGPARAMDVTVR